MKFLFGILGSFIITVLFLSIEIAHKPIFGHIYKTISPATKSAQRSLENFFDSSYDKTQRYSKKLFENSIPKFSDTVKSKMSATKKHTGEPAEKITNQEKDELDELIKSHR